MIELDEWRGAPPINKINTAGSIIKICIFFFVGFIWCFVLISIIERLLGASRSNIDIALD